MNEVRWQNATGTKNCSHQVAFFRLNETISKYLNFVLRACKISLNAALALFLLTDQAHMKPKKKTFFEACDVTKSHILTRVTNCCN